MLQVVGESGPAVLLLPGGAEAVSGFFPRLVEGLVADPGCRVILYDRPGTVGTEVEGPLAEATRTIHATLSDLGLGPVVMVGQSLGAAVALLSARDHPEDVAGLVLLDPTPINDVPLADRVERAARLTVTLSGLPVLGGLVPALFRATARRSVRRHRPSPDVRQAMLDIAEIDVPRLGRAVLGLATLARGFSESQLPRVPAVVVTADRRSGSALHGAHARLAAALGTPLVSWPGAEHAVHLTHPDEVLAVCRQVVRRVMPAGGPAGR